MPFVCQSGSESQLLLGAVVPCGRNNDVVTAEGLGCDNNTHKGSSNFVMKRKGGITVHREEDAIPPPVMKPAFTQQTVDDDVFTSNTTASSRERYGSWSSTNAVVGDSMIRPARHNQHHDPIVTMAFAPAVVTVPSTPTLRMERSSKASFFSTDAFDEDDEESLLSFVSGVATGNASSECSFNTNNNNNANISCEYDDDVRSDTSICEIFNLIDVMDNACVSPVPPTSLSISDGSEQQKYEMGETDATKPIRANNAVAAVNAVTELSCTHHNQPQSAATPTSAPKKATIMQAPLRQSRAPLLPADPTTKYRKIMKTYGFTAVHHVCLTTLYQEHQRYVAALAKADPTLHPSPFPFVKELAAQQHAVNAHACL